MPNKATFPTWARWLSALVFATIALGLFYGSRNPVEDQSGQAQYPGPWVDAPNSDLTKALIANKVGGCGQYAYRRSAKQDGEFLLFCSSDGRIWRSYIVWLPIGRVIGPLETVPGIAPPA